MLKKFCPRCGKDTPELFDGLCEECFRTTQKIIEAPEHLSILLCSCGRSHEKRHWHQNESMDSLIENLITDNIKVDPDAKIEIEYPDPKVEGRTKIPIEITATKKFQSGAITQTAQVLLTINPQVCDVCSRISGSYFEAILQIRGPEYIQKKLFKFAEEKVNQYKSTDKYSFITKIIESKEGTDIYLGSMKIAKKIEQEAKRIYNVESKISDSICGTKDGKPLKRLTVLLKGK